MSLSVRRRILSEYPWHQYRRTVNIVGTEQVSDYSGKFYGRQITESEGHAWPKGRATQDVGGPFDTLKLEHQASIEPSTGTWYRNDPYQGLDEGHGSIQPMLVNAVHPAFYTAAGTDASYRAYVTNTSTDATLNALGAKMISSSIPTNPILDGSVSVAELFREGLPSIIGSTFLKDKVHSFRSLGGEYLNVEFGWKPLISDLQSASKAILESEAILNNLAKHSGKRLHRFRMLPDETSTVVTIDSNGGITPIGGTNITHFATRSVGRQTDSFFKRTWFSGEFTYHYEPSHMTEVQRIANQARLLYGLEITPETLWNLAPWSWLVDWVTNVGPVLRNLTAFQQDGLVMRYGYVMEETRRTQTFTNTPGSPASGVVFPHTGPLTFVFKGTRKRRLKANPYGFGVTMQSLTSRQLNILVALGLARS